MSLKMLSAVCLFGMLLSGCLFEPYRPVNEFDLTVRPVEDAPAAALQILELRNDSSAGLRLQFRDASGRVIRDPYNSWVLPPGELVARALNLALRREGASRTVALQGALEVFEVDSAARTFRLVGFYHFPGDRNVFRFDCSVPVEGDSAGQVAAAASAAVEKLAAQIALWTRAELKGGR